MRVLLLASLLLIAACGAAPEPPLVATDLTVTRPMPGMNMSAAYLSLTNNSDQAITITRVHSNEYKAVELHESTIEDGIARMRAIPQLRIAAGETVIMRRGGKPLMLMRPTGDADLVTLEFYDGEALLLTVSSTYASRSQ